MAGLLALLLPHLGAAPLERAEIYFLDAARAMVEGGDWVVPRYQGQPFFDKPILTYWLMAAFMAAWGPEAGPGRLVTVVSAVGIVLATAWLGTLLFSRRTALVGALVLATTLGFLSFGRIAMSDVPLTLFTTLAVALGVRAWGASPPRWTAPALGAALGLGFATKGPVALLVAGLALLVLLYRNRARPLPLPAGHLVAGLVAFGVIGFGWFALVYGRLGTEPLSYFFLRENLERFAGEAYDVGRPIWFYVPAYFAEGLPWSPLLPLALFRLLRSDGGVEAGGAASRFLAAWAALVLVPLSLSRGKIDYYLLPLYPAASLLVGRFLTHVPWRRLERAWVGTSLALLAALLGYALVYPPRVPEPWLPSPAARGAFLFVLGAAVLALLLTAVRPTPARVAAALAASVALGWFVLVVAFLPAFASAQPNRLVAADVAREKAWQPALRFAVCADPSRARRDVLLHARLAAVETCDVWGFAASTVPHLLLVTSSQAASLEALPKWRHVETYRCVPARALTLEGLFTLGEPSEVVLGANFATEDPVAERKRKREYRKGFQRAREEEAARARAKRP